MVKADEASELPAEFVVSEVVVSVFGLSLFSQVAFAPE